MIIIIPPIAVNTIPRALFKTFSDDLLANLADTCAPMKVKIIQSKSTLKSGIPPIIKCDEAPVNAVNAIINTLVPTAVFNSYPNTLV